MIPCNRCNKMLKHGEENITEVVYCNRCNGKFCLECWNIQRREEEEGKKSLVEINEKEINFILFLIHDRIIKLVQEIRQKELILNNEPLRRKYPDSVLNLFKNDIDTNWNSIKSLKRIANNLRKDCYSEDETR